MLKNFIGLSDDGFRVYEAFTPGEKGQVGIKMIMGYRDSEFIIYSSEVWEDPHEEAMERMAQAAADSSRTMQKHFADLHRRGGKSGLFARPYIGALSIDPVIGDFSALEALSQLSRTEVVNKRGVFKEKPQFFLDEHVKIEVPKLADEQQGHPKRKPQPNRGPRGRKDWK